MSSLYVWILTPHLQISSPFTRLTFHFADGFLHCLKLCLGSICSCLLLCPLPEEDQYECTACVFF